MQSFRDLTTDDLSDMNAHNNARVRQLERTRLWNTVKDEQELAARRATARQLKKALKERIKQLTLF